MIQKMILVLSLLLGTQLAMAQDEPYKEGVHYFKIDQAPTETSSDKVEVTEFFSYACSHCNTFDPYVESWRQNQPDNVVFDRIAVAFGRKAWEMLARGYITAEMLGVADKTHVAMMDAIWKQGKQFRSVDELANFYASLGVDKAAFMANYQSFAADSQLRKSQHDVQLFGIAGTPSLVVNRQYRVAGNKDVKDFDAMLDVVDYLVKKESAPQ
ncbi:MAG: thiol:disulfide interchange protein DsbA/DsbL [Lysobacterales bacterium]